MRAGLVSKFFGFFLLLTIAPGLSWSVNKQAAPASGEDILRTIDVDFGPLPIGWVKETNIMDPIWGPMGLSGVNYYAYAGPPRAGARAGRLDTNSPAYQAWFGVYVIALPAGAHARVDSIDTAIRLADLDQRSWLQAMGDPQPLGLVDAEHHARGSIRVDGRTVPLFVYAGKSHSDVGAVHTPLRQHLNDDDATSWQSFVAPFHDVLLHGNFAFFTDTRRGVAVIIYSAAPSFHDKNGKQHDLYKPLKAEFLSLMRSVRLNDKK